VKPYFSFSSFSGGLSNVHMPSSARPSDEPTKTNTKSSIKIREDQSLFLIVHLVTEKI
jgi:hypothetical protein